MVNQQERLLVLWAMQELNAAPGHVQRLMPLPFKKAVEELEVIKVEARKRYKQAAFKWHPDRNPDNQAEAEARFKVLGFVLNELEALQIRQRPPQQPRQVSHVVFHRNTAAASTDTSTVSWVDAPRPWPTPDPRNYDVRRVVYINVI